MTTNDVQIIYFSGYIRNWQSLCDTLGIALPLSREEREAAILKTAYAEWGTDMAQQLCGTILHLPRSGRSEAAVLCGCGRRAALHGRHRRHRDGRAHGKAPE